MKPLPLPLGQPPCQPTCQPPCRPTAAMLYFVGIFRPSSAGAARPFERMTDTAGNPESIDPTAPDPAREAARRAHLNQLLTRVGQGDQSAFAELYRLASARVFATIVRMVHDRAEAEDLLQDVFTTAWRRADLFDPARGGAMTWLVTLARNRTIDRLRQHHETPLEEDSELELADDHPTPAALAEASEERRRLEHCLEQLAPQQHRAVREAFFSGATYSELATQLSVPLGTLKSWIRRSLMQLKTCLER
jgi:RNA polymerase sigma factor (sigma-70 family)